MASLRHFLKRLFTRDPSWRSPAHKANAKAETIPVVALVDHQDRDVLTTICDGGKFDVHFVESNLEAWTLANRLMCPVVLYDRDWPNTEWRKAVQTLASSPHRASVILTSRVADDSLWEEVIRCGGYAVLAKPLRADDVARVMKLALSYWLTARAATRQ